MLNIHAALIPHPSAPLPSFQSLDWDSMPDDLRANQQVFYLLRGHVLLPLERCHPEEREETLHDQLQLAWQCRGLPAMAWTYDDHPWLLLWLAAEIQRHVGVVTCSGEGVALSDQEPFSRWALEAVLSAGSVTLAQCLTHPNLAVRQVAARHARLTGC